MSAEREAKREFWHAYSAKLSGIFSLIRKLNFYQPGSSAYEG